MTSGPSSPPGGPLSESGAGGRKAVPPPPGQHPTPPPPAPADRASADAGAREAAEAQLSRTRAAAAWLFTAVALVVLVLLIILILQNEQRVQVTYLGLEAWLPLGVALLIAAVAGGAIVTIIGTIRLTQIRRNARRVRRLREQSRRKV